MTEQHDTTFTLPAGEQVTVEACVIYRFSDGKIFRVDEYVDLAPLASVIGSS